MTGSSNMAKPFLLISRRRSSRSFVWSNAAVVAKAVDSAELAVWKLLDERHIDGIPTLLGFMRIRTTPNHGQTLIFTTNCGEPVALDLEGMSSRYPFPENQ
jgi:hypothetical protein